MGSPCLGDPGAPTAEEGAEQGQCQSVQTPREELCGGGKKLQSTKHRASGDAEHRATPCIGRVPALPQGTLQQAGQEQLSPSPAL